jgi:hypothetical protein
MNGQMPLVEMFADACIPSIYEAINLMFLMPIHVSLPLLASLIQKTENICYSSSTKGIKMQKNKKKFIWTVL